MNHQKIPPQYILGGFLIVIFTWIAHEFAHWLSSESFGNETKMTLNGTSFIGGENPTDLQKVLISASGPTITLIQALFAYLLLKSRN